MSLGHLKVSRKIELAGLVESLTVWGEYRHKLPRSLLVPLQFFTPHLLTRE
jgi:hypothetical protein